MLVFAAGSGYHTPLTNNKGRVNDMTRSLFGLLLLGLSVTSANAIDMKELAPCRPAAARFCDRSGGMTMANLLRCGATLAANSARVGNGCRQVLRRYGQL
jgi:hypothetical protein